MADRFDLGRNLTSDVDIPVEERGGMLPAKIIDALPEIHRTDPNRRMFDATFEPLFSKPQIEKLIGYVGKKSEGNSSESDFFIDKDIPGTDGERNFYQLNPCCVVRDSVTGGVTNVLFYEDMVRILKAQGADVSNEARLFETVSYSWMPPINIDMLLNYQNYYWYPEAGARPPVIKFPEMAENVTNLIVNGDVVTHTGDLVSYLTGNSNYKTASINNIPLVNGMIVSFGEELTSAASGISLTSGRTYEVVSDIANGWQVAESIDSEDFTDGSVLVTDIDTNLSGDIDVNSTITPGQWNYIFPDKDETTNDGSTSSSNTGPGNNNILNYMYFETSSGRDEQSAALSQFTIDGGTSDNSDVTNWLLSKALRRVVMDVCLQGRQFDDANHDNGLYLLTSTTTPTFSTNQATKETEVRALRDTAQKISGWAYNNSRTVGDSASDYAGNPFEVVANGGWRRVVFDIPSDARWVGFTADVERPGTPSGSRSYEVDVAIANISLEIQYDDWTSITTIDMISGQKNAVKKGDVIKPSASTDFTVASFGNNAKVQQKSIVEGIGKRIKIVDYKTGSSSDKKDYITIDRSEDNAWSNSNYWFHKDALLIAGANNIFGQLLAAIANYWSRGELGLSNPSRPASLDGEGWDEAPWDVTFTTTDRDFQLDPERRAENPIIQFSDDVPTPANGKIRENREPIFNLPNNAGQNKIFGFKDGKPGREFVNHIGSLRWNLGSSDWHLSDLSQERDGPYYQIPHSLEANSENSEISSTEVLHLDNLREHFQSIISGQEDPDGLGYNNTAQDGSKGKFILQHDYSLFLPSYILAKNDVVDLPSAIRQSVKDYIKAKRQIINRANEYIDGDDDSLTALIDDIADQARYQDRVTGLKGIGHTPASAGLAIITTPSVTNEVVTCHDGSKERGLKAEQRTALLAFETRIHTGLASSDRMNDTDMDLSHRLAIRRHPNGNITNPLSVPPLGPVPGLINQLHYEQSTFNSILDTMYYEWLNENGLEKGTASKNTFHETTEGLLALVILLYIIRPANFINIGWNANLSPGLAKSQIIHEDNVLTNSNFVPGYQTFIKNYLESKNLNWTAFVNDIRTTQINMGWKMGGFVDTGSLKIDLGDD